MKQTISKSDFRAAFHKCGRGEQFSYDALGAMFDYLVQIEEAAMFDYPEEIEEAGGEELELDPIACCCEFAEYKNIKEFQAAYSDEYETIEDIKEVTSVIPIDEDSFLIVQF